MDDQNSNKINSLVEQNILDDLLIVLSSCSESEIESLKEYFLKLGV